MVLVWNERFATGLNWQDAQHQELFNRMNTLLDAMQAGRDTGSLEEAFAFFESYMTKHFADEERFMKELGLPGFADHKAAHEELRIHHTELKAAFIREGVSPGVRIKFQNMLVDWLVSHIGNMDRKIVEETVARSSR